MTKALPQILRSESELFSNDGQKRTWKKGQISNPRWLNRENGFDFITIKTAMDVQDAAKYLSGEDDRLACEYYNTFTTGHDKTSNRMICLFDQSEAGDMKKIAVIVINASSELSMLMVQFVEEFCQ